MPKGHMRLDNVLFAPLIIEQHAVGPYRGQRLAVGAGLVFQGEKKGSAFAHFAFSPDPPAMPFYYARNNT